MAHRRAAVRLLTAAVLVTGAAGAVSSQATTTRPAARDLAATWLSTYVQPDGRVARLDQGNDTVSEGVSYALALADETHDLARSRLVWGWAKSHMLRSDGLLSYRTDASGNVLDGQAATDADVLTAWALLRSGDGSLAADGRKLADAVLWKETVHAGPNAYLLAAGPWATGSPASLNPSYWMFPVLRDLAWLTGNTGWTALADSAGTALANLPAALAADWVRADGATLANQPAPDGSAPEPRHGLDAQRVEVWSAHSCTYADQAPARRAAGVVNRDGNLSTDLAGNPRSSYATPLGLIAAGRQQAAYDLSKQYPTYYGNAWVALDAALGDGLVPC